MNKPVLPVSATWIRPISPTERFVAYTPLSNVPDIDLFSFDRRITVIGAFGRFLTIEFETRLYVMPVPMVQCLLWSFDENLGHQFSDEEQRLLIGTWGKADVITTLERELTNVCQWLQKNPAPSNLATSPSTPAKHEVQVTGVAPDGCPEPLFFDEVQS